MKCVITFLILLNICYGFYLPGIKPHEYEFQEGVKIKVNKLDSVLTQLPYDYYQLPFCKPGDGVKISSELVEYIYIYRYINT